MALVNAYGLRTAGGARGNVAAATYLVPAGRIFKCTQLSAATDDATGGTVFLTTAAGGGVPANDVAALYLLTAVNPSDELTFATPIQFAAGTTVTVDTDAITGGGGTSLFVSFRGYTQ